VSTAPSSSARDAQQALGARLREIRQDAGLTGRALAAATGQHFTRVSKIEHGGQAPSDRDIRDWCRACGAENQVQDLIATARAVQSAYRRLDRILDLRQLPRRARNPTASIEVTRPHEIGLYTRMFDHLKASAVHGTAARALIVRALGELG
jgi:transcriptional regulator with XRE-family HTH domain